MSSVLLVLEAASTPKSGNDFTAQIAQLLTACGFGAIVIALINWLGNRKKKGADAAVVLSGEARAWAATAMSRVDKAEERADNIEKEAAARLKSTEDKYEERLRRVEKKADTCQARVRELELHITDLHEIIIELGGDPPPVP